MRSWTVWSAVSTMNCRLRYRKTGAGAKLVQSLRFKLERTFKPQKSTRIPLQNPIRATEEMAFEGILNTLGVMLGYCVLRLYKKISSKAATG